MARGPRSHVRTPYSVDELRLALDKPGPSESEATVEEQIYDHKLAGHSVRDIAIIVKRPTEEVETVIARMAESSRRRFAAELSIAAILELDRMDRLLKALWPVAMLGDFGAIDRVSAITKERRKLLGTDAPEVRATLHISESEQVDLSVLSLKQIKAWEEIQATLARAKSTPTIDVTDTVTERQVPALKSGSSPSEPETLDPEPESV
jgi:hypothetical protein